MKLSMGSELYNLANEFKNSTDVTEEFLADPDDTTNTGWFQVVSQRNCYVVKKVIPSSKITLDDWYNRYMQIDEFTERTGEEINSLMHTEGIKYILCINDNYCKFDDVQDYEIFLKSETDSFRIYKLN